MESADPDRDADQLAGVLAGRPECWEAFVRRYTPMVFAIAAERAGDDPAGDITQTVFAELWRLRSRLAGKPRAEWVWWLAETARRRTRDSRRADVRRTAREQAYVAARDARAASDDPSVTAERADEVRVVMAAIDRLGHKHRDALILHYLGGLRADEIAARMGAPADTVKTRVSVGLRKLRQQLAPATAAAGEP